MAIAADKGTLYNIRKCFRYREQNNLGTWNGTKELWNCLQHVYRETVYKTIVRPKREYACEAWDPHYKKDNDKQEKVQRKNSVYSIMPH